MRTRDDDVGSRSVLPSPLWKWKVLESADDRLIVFIIDSSNNKGANRTPCEVQARQGAEGHSQLLSVRGLRRSLQGRPGVLGAGRRGGGRPALVMPVPPRPRGHVTHQPARRDSASPGSWFYRL